MTSWIYLFSKFTPEALLFEALLIFSICAGYAAFWVLYKRRLGAAKNAVPASLVKSYLNELIGDAEQIRVQLFGLLTGGAIPAGATGATLAQFQTTAPGATAPAQIASLVGDVQAAGDPAKIAAFEAKMQEQAKAVESLVADKARMEKELREAKAAATTGGAGATAAAGGADVSKLTEKIRLLEGKLAEYSVIEDDLANLKRLQQENAQLKAQLTGKGIAPATAAPVESVVAAPEPVAAAPVAEPAPEVVAPTPEPTPSFEGLVDQVEASLQQPAAAVPEPAAAPEAAVAPTEAAAAPLPEVPAEKSDADLVAEFEKMLNG